MRQEKIKILIISEDSERREFLRMILQENQYEVLEAFDISTGTQKVYDLFPDLIISDINFTELDVYHLITELFIYPETINTPIILLATESDMKEYRLAMDSGADDFIPLPLEKKIILNSIKARLKKNKIGKEYSEVEKKLFRQRISSMLPHEFSTPLMGISCGLEILSNQYEEMSDEERKEMIEVSQSSAKRLSRMNKNYLQFIELEMSNYDIELLSNLKRGNISDIEYTVHNVSNEEANNSNRLSDLEINLPSEKFSIPISDGHFRTIISEVVNNAFKFSEPGQKIVITGIISNDKFILKIQDSGRGMSIEEINKIGAYVQFRRIVHEQQGVGLGLFISKKLIEIHEGHLEIISEVDKGTTITIEFPIILQNINEIDKINVE